MQNKQNKRKVLVLNESINEINKSIHLKIVQVSLEVFQVCLSNHFSR